MSAGKPSSVHVPALDGIRGLAILLVIICHLSEPFHLASGPWRYVKAAAFAGWTGVDLFFVLSGYLITGILWDAKGTKNYFVSFYARRTVRIFPLYYATLAVLFLIVPVISPSSYLASTRQYWLWYVTYFADFLVAWKGFLFLGHFWTLAVEERFYLVWPLLVHRLARRTLIWISLFIVVEALILRFCLILAHVSPIAVYVLTPCRMDGLAAGAILALVAREPRGLQRLAGIARWTLPLSAIVWIVLMWHRHGWFQYGLVEQTAGYLTTTLFYGSVVVFALASQRTGRLLSNGMLRLFGKYSYGMYVLHVFPAVWLTPYFALGDSSHWSVLSWLSHSPNQSGMGLWLDGLLFCTTCVGMTFFLAFLSWRILELPCLRLKRFFPYGARHHTSLEKVSV